MANRRDLSIILPCYRGTSLAVRSTQTLIEFFETQPLDWEAIVVDDGGNDFEATPLPSNPRVRLVRHSRNLGKGAAVRTGVLAAVGDVRIYTDVDLPYDLELFATFHAYVKETFHLAIGDRTMPGSIYAENNSLGRNVLSALSAAFVGSLVTGGFHDTQCGIKAIRGDIADALFPLVTITGFAFDVEVIYLALKHRLDIKRVPVQLRRNETSSVRPFRDGLGSLVDVLGIKIRQMQGKYRSALLEATVQEEARRARESVRVPPIPGARRKS